MKDGDILATAKFRVFGKTLNGDDFDSIVETKLCKSGAFAYGNQTCMVWRWDYGRIDTFDTRYDKVNAKTFKDFAQKCLRSHCADSIAIECISN